MSICQQIFSHIGILGFIMTIGNRVLALLAEKGLKQKDLAAHLNTGASTINGWKSPHRNPSSHMILPICEFLDVSCEYLLSGSDSKKKLDYSTADEEWLSLIHQLPAEAQLEFKGELKGYLKHMKESVAADSPKTGTDNLGK